MAIDVSTKYWSDRITDYCIKHRMSYKAFSKLCEVHNNTIVNIVNQKSKKVNTTTIAMLLKTLDNTQQ